MLRWVFPKHQAKDKLIPLFKGIKYNRGRFKFFEWIDCYFFFGLSMLSPLQLGKIKACGGLEKSRPVMTGYRKPG
jgi:hypothetical protein